MRPFAERRRAYRRIRRRWELVGTVFDAALVALLAFEASRVWGSHVFWFVALAGWFILRVWG